MRKLFLLEDDLSLISGLTFAFKKQGFALDTARTLAEAEVLWSDRKYDLLVLDVSLPDGSGFDFCQKVRRTSNVPILFLTASDEEMNIIMGLELGGDDYLTKPFKLGVLLSRVNALLRRANASSAGEPVLESGSITVRLLQGQAYKNGILLELTGAEYKLLCFFMQHPNAVLSKEQILDALWDCDGDYIDSSALTVYIRRLRMKIEDDPGKPQMLLTVRGMGYKWNANGISLTLNRGDRIALVGRNGCGKSSLLKLLVGQPIAHTGTLEIGSRLTVSYVPQDTSFLSGSADDFAAESEIDITLFKTILRKLDFKRTQFTKDMSEFSMGQKKKVLLARSLCQRANLYIWDEPLNYIDVISRLQIETLILEYKPTMLFVEHDEAFVNDIATKVCRISLNQ